MTVPIIPDLALLVMAGRTTTIAEIIDALDRSPELEIATTVVEKENKLLDTSKAKMIIHRQKGPE